jgi:hypothetical protein
LREGGLTDYDSTGRDGGTIGAVGVLVGEAGPLVVASAIDRRQNAEAGHELLENRLFFRAFWNAIRLRGGYNLELQVMWTLCQRLLPTNREGNNRHDNDDWKQ